jgi:hypothetical protein
MNQTPKSPYLTAALHASDTELDMSGSRPFSLELVVTLHALEPIILYTDDTFLMPRTALHQGGIDFFRIGSDEGPVGRSTIYVNKGNGPYRSWSSLLTLQPETPTVIHIPFNSQRPSTAPKDGHFDAQLWINASSFETGNTYKAVIPSAVKISWWRWEKQGKVSWWQWATRGTVSWLRWAIQGKGDDEEDVPVLPEEEQLSICVVDTNVTFTCIGQPVVPPTQTR